MNQPVSLIFLPGETPLIGVWRPGYLPEWVGHTLAPKTSGTTLLHELQRFLAHEKLDLNQVKSIGVMAGPASYTHLRLFVSTANALAWSLAIPVFGFSAQSKLPEDLPVLVRQAKRNVPLEPVYPTKL